MAERYGSEQAVNSQDKSRVVMRQDNTRVSDEAAAGSGFDEKSPSDSDSPSDTPPSRSREVASTSSPSSSRPSSLRSGQSSRPTTQSDTDSSEVDNIRVVVRVRPLNPSEKEKTHKNIIKLPGDGAIWIDNSFGQIKPFTFNAALGEATTQAEMFEGCGIKHLIDMAIQGYSCTAFAFGRTGSGKTFTITGPLDGQYQEGALPTPHMQGLIERSFQYMFHEMEKKSERVNYTLRASYLEVYNEKVKDLLNPSSAHDSLPVRWSRDRGFYVENLFYVECDTMDDLIAVLEEGLRYRQVGSHMMNDHSSRSHSMLTVYIDIELCDIDDDSGFSTFRHGKLSFVDLAGSERVKETKSVGETFTESQNINKSLLTLGNCISALSDQRKRTGHIPYRDSKLTKLLADSLGGDGITLMIACISPCSSVVSDTLNTLRYANRAKKIKNKPVVQMDPKEKLILGLKREIKLLRTENNYFRQQLGLPSSESQTTVQTISPKETTDQNENTVCNDSSEQRQANKLNSLFVREDHDRNKLTTASLTAGANSGLYDMLQEYMMENEYLRTENSDLHKSREEVSRQQTIVSRENERLLKKLEDLERVFVTSPVSMRSLSGVERSHSEPENKKNQSAVRRPSPLAAHDSNKSSSNPDIHTIDKPISAAAAIFARRHSIPDPHAVRTRSISEPKHLRFPPLANGPYPNYVNETWPTLRDERDSSAGGSSTHARSLPEEPRLHPHRKPLSKSSPAKIQKKRTPAFVAKPTAGYASIFSKQKEKEKRAKQIKRKETPPRVNPPPQHLTSGYSQPTHAPTYAQHPGLTAPAPINPYQSQGVPAPGYHVTQPGVPDVNMVAYYTPQAQTGPADPSRLSQGYTRDLEDLDSQIEYYSQIAQQNHYQQNPHR